MYIISVIYPRKLKKRILKALDSDLTVVVTGMRRVGKTYLLQDIFNSITGNNKLFLDLEKRENAKIFKEESTDRVIRNLELLGLTFHKKSVGEEADLAKRAWIFLDEIQQVKTAVSFIKYLSDHYHVKFLVSGSSSFYLKNLFSESLSGRKVVFELRPLDFGEFLIFNNIQTVPFISKISELSQLNTQMVVSKYQRFFEEYLTIGGFPQAVIAGNEEEREQILKDILTSYIMIDVKTLSDIRRIDDLEKLIYLLPGRIGQKVDISKLASIVGVVRPTIKNYLNFLHDTFVINLISPYSKSPDREISVTPKLYFCDGGLASILSRPSEGQLFENYVHSHLLGRYSLNYYQRKSGTEIDFVLNKEIGVEAKLFADWHDYKKLKNICQDIKLSKSMVFSKIPPSSITEGILPAFLLGFLDI